MSAILSLLADPAAWAALATLIVMEVVLGIDNLVFVSILSNRLPPEQQTSARRLGIALALVLRLALLGDDRLAGRADRAADRSRPPRRRWSTAIRSFDTAFSLRDLILIAGGLFLIWKATSEIHHTIDGDDASARRRRAKPARCSASARRSCRSSRSTSSSRSIRS